MGCHKPPKEARSNDYSPAAASLQEFADRIPSGQEVFIPLETTYGNNILYYYKTTTGVLYTDIKKTKYALRRFRDKWLQVKG